MLDRKSLLLIIVSCGVFQNVFPSPIFPFPFKGALENIRCGLHHVGDLIFSQDHRHHGACNSHYSGETVISDHHHVHDHEKHYSEDEYVHDDDRYIAGGSHGYGGYSGSSGHVHAHDGGYTGFHGFKLGVKGAFAGGLGVGVAGFRDGNALNKTVAEDNEFKHRNALNETVTEDRSASQSTSKSEESNKDDKTKTIKVAYCPKGQVFTGERCENISI